ncbi:hypothetical protein [[Mycoplasma] anseris]|uniref:Uncharacterized protein n=1 Tax=[Mycoplasma] anseris TaxID=92400 RepID=A0A2Z4NED5_9BACT|nr:hypothetical protein [[Mycoplasma] anseris]AWX69715.1 hypothetical protein DP065_03130 [[Mycoplasma] anseris]
MKRTIVTILKIFQDKYEIEVVEETLHGIFSIFKNSETTSLFNINSFKKFVYDSKIKIEQIIQGKLKEVILLISENEYANLNIKNIKIESSVAMDNQQLNDLIINKCSENNKFLLSNRKIKFLDYTQKQTINQNYFKQYNSLITISNSFLKEIKYTLEKINLNLANCYFLEEMELKTLLLNEKQIALNVKMNLNNTNLFLSFNNTIIKTFKINFGLAKLINKIKTNSKLNEELLFFYTKNLIKNKPMIAKNEVYTQFINDFLNELALEIKEIINKNQINQENLQINLFGFLANNEFVQTILQSKIGDNQIYSLYVARDLISDEAKGVINLLASKDFINKANITTETFIIDSNIINNITNKAKIIRRKIFA